MNVPLLGVGDRERIHDHCKGRRFLDCKPAHQRVLLQFDDGYEVDIDWASSGPELREARQRLIVTNEYALPVEFAKVRGLTVSQVVTDGVRLYLCFTDGHELVLRFEGEPDARAVNVRIDLPAAVASGATWP